MIANKHILEQGPVIAGLVRTVLGALIQERFPKKTPLSTPTAEIAKEIKPPSGGLVRAYVQHVGGQTSHYTKTLPPHLFPQWAFPVAGKSLAGIPYPMLKVVNGGCRIEINKPLPNDEPLRVRACLHDIEDNGRRAVLHQKIITETASAPDALISHIYSIVPSAKTKSKSKGAKTKRTLPTVPKDVRELAIWRLRANAGLDFAKLTGDFNPIHWVPAYAKAAGFKNTILHGFGTFARAMEGVTQSMCTASSQIKTFDVKFTRPLVLPATVGLYVSFDNQVYVGDAPGGPAYMRGSFTLS